MKRGFTLAEVLITLGIIGVVAALTIPTLIQNYKNTVYVNQLKKSYSVIQNGFKLIISQDGVAEMSDTDFMQVKNNYSITSDDFYNQTLPMFKNAFNIIQSYSATEYKSLNPKSNLVTDSNYCKQNVGKTYGLSYKLYNKDMCIPESGILFILKDGSYFILESASSPFISEIFIDVNGLKAPNMYGFDAFSFMLLIDGSVVPSGSEKYAKTKGGETNWKSYYWSTGVGYTCKAKGNAYTGYGSGCAASIIENGWKINY